MCVCVCVCLLIVDCQVSPLTAVRNSMVVCCQTLLQTLRSIPPSLSTLLSKTFSHSSPPFNPFLQVLPSDTSPIPTRPRDHPSKQSSVREKTAATAADLGSWDYVVCLTLIWNIFGAVVFFQGCCFLYLEVVFGLCVCVVVWKG